MKLIWTDRARANLSAIQDEIAAEQPQAAKWVTHEIRRTAELVGLWPDIGTSAPQPGVKTFPIPRTKYILAFQKIDNAVYVVAIFHGARNWQEEFPM